jgi:hypothetical protein
MRIRLSAAYNRPADRLKRLYEETGKNRGYAAFASHFSSIPCNFGGCIRAEACTKITCRCSLSRRFFPVPCGTMLGRVHALEPRICPDTGSQ